MIIYQTDYIDFLDRTTLSKFSKVKSIFNRPEYHPAFDFYKNIREEFVDYVKLKKDKNDLYDFLNYQHQRKHARFEVLINGYLKFLGRKNAEFFDPPTGFWQHKDLSIKLNPEMGININGERYIVKMYFKDIPLSKSSVNVLLWMMEGCLSTGIYTGYKCALLDVERSKLHYFKKPHPPIDALLEGESESFIRMWQSLEKKSA
jgi:hypothetical protein